MADCAAVADAGATDVSSWPWEKPTPPPPKPPPPGDILIHCTLAGDVDLSKPPQLDVDNVGIFPCVVLSTTRVQFTLPGTTPPWGWGITWGESQEWRSPDPLFRSGAHEGPLLEYRRLIPVPTAWTIDGQYFRDAASREPVFEISADAFNAFADYVEHGPESVQPALDELYGLGFNTVRVFTGVRFPADFSPPVPFDCVHQLDRLLDFWRFCAHRGLRVHQTVFPMPLVQTEGGQTAIYLTIDAMARQCPWVRLEGVNEGDDARNAAPGLMAVDPNALGNRLASHGSTIQDGGYLSPPWYVADYHPARNGDDWPRKPGHNAWEDVAAKLNIPCCASEIRRPDEDGFRPHKFYEAAAGAALQCAGITFHSQSGKLARPLLSQERACAEAFVAGAKDVPLGYRTGSYTRGGLTESPIEWASDWPGRAHAKIVGGRACVTITGSDPSAWANVMGRDGWKIDARRGEFGQVVLLSR